MRSSIWSKAALGLSLVLLTTPAGATDTKPGTISVSATGAATLTPDMAVIGLTVQREGETARQALDANSKAMSEVMQALKETGIADRDLQTSGFNIQPRYLYPKRLKTGEQKPPEIVGYSVSNSLTVRIRKLDNLGAILDQAVTLGVNSGGNIMFQSSNSAPAVETARKKAMKNALAKAATLTTAANVKLGRILQISEQGGRPPQPRTLARSLAAEAQSKSVPVAAGENSYSITVNVTWELTQ